MIEIKFKIWPYLKPTGQVAIRVLWNSCKTKCEFATEVYAEKSKWDDDMHRAKKNATHLIKLKKNVRKFESSEINEQISIYKDEIEAAFYAYSMKNSVPTADDLKEMVNSALGKNVNEMEEMTTAKSTLKDLYDAFILKGKREKNWDEECVYKYQQAYNQFTSANPHIKPNNITETSMYNLREWFIKNQYRNRTTNKQFIILKAFLKYIDSTGEYTIPQNVFKYKTNLKVIKRTVTFLHYKELLKFAQFEFKKKDSRLDKARDLWCFMAFTSLRYSDLSKLRPGHIKDNKRIEKVAQKTDEHLLIPLTEGALKIIEKYKDKPGKNGLLFDVPSNQKMNDYVKLAAKEAGLDREIIDTYYIGTERKEESYKFHEIIGCHDARRTFVSCSLAMGIPVQVVMKCTGHSDYETMKPYIEIASETQSIQMEKWNSSQYKSQIITLLENASENDLKDILDVIKKKVVMKQDITKGNDIEADEEDEELDGSILTVDDDTPFNIIEEMAKGNIIHLEYDPNEEHVCKG